MGMNYNISHAFVYSMLLAREKKNHLNIIRLGISKAYHVL